MISKEELSSTLKARGHESHDEYVLSTYRKCLAAGDSSDEAIDNTYVITGTPKWLIRKLASD